MVSPLPWEETYFYPPEGSFFEVHLSVGAAFRWMSSSRDNGWVTQYRPCCAVVLGPNDNSFHRPTRCVRVSWTRDCQNTAHSLSLTVPYTVPDLTAISDCEVK